MSIAYKGYLIRRHSFMPDRYWIEKNGQHISYCLDVADGKRIINELTA